jgi:hypothetical protein
MFRSLPSAAICSVPKHRQLERQVQQMFYPASRDANSRDKIFTIILITRPAQLTQPVDCFPLNYVIGELHYSSSLPRS